MHLQERGARAVDALPPARSNSKRLRGQRVAPALRLLQRRLNALRALLNLHKALCSLSDPVCETVAETVQGSAERGANLLQELIPTTLLRLLHTLELRRNLAKLPPYTGKRGTLFC